MKNKFYDENNRVDFSVGNKIWPSMGFPKYITDNYLILKRDDNRNFKVSARGYNNLSKLVAELRVI